MFSFSILLLQFLICSFSEYLLTFQVLASNNLFKMCLITLFLCLFVCLFLFFFFLFRHMGSQFHNQGLNPCPLHWDDRDLSTGPQGKSLFLIVYSLQGTVPRLEQRASGPTVHSIHDCKHIFITQQDFLLQLLHPISLHDVFLCLLLS